jgi:hypothetical protein
MSELRGLRISPRQQTHRKCTPALQRLHLKLCQHLLRSIATHVGGPFSLPTITV